MGGGECESGSNSLRERKSAAWAQVGRRCMLRDIASLRGSGDGRGRARGVGLDAGWEKGMVMGAKARGRRPHAPARLHSQARESQPRLL